MSSSQTESTKAQTCRRHYLPLATTFLSSMGLQYFTFIALACTFLPVIWLRKYSRRLVTSQRRRRAALLDQLGISLDNLHKTKLVGFFHPYWFAASFYAYYLWQDLIPRSAST